MMKADDELISSKTQTSTEIIPLEPIVAAQPTVIVELSGSGTAAIAYDHEARPGCFSNTTAEISFVLITTFAIGQYAILEGVLMTMSARIQKGLDMNAAEVTWLLAGMALTSGAFLVFFGRVADLFGRRKLLILSMAVYTALMLLTGFSQDAVMIEIVLALVGISCAAVVPPAIGKLGAIYERPSRRKNAAFACFSAGNPVGFVVGAFLGGVITQISSWRTTFWAIAVLYGMLTVIAWFVTPLDSEQRLGGFNRQTFGQMDWLGAFLAVAGIALFTAAFTIGPEGRRGWATPYIIVMLVIGVIAMAAFVFWQSKFKAPLMPLYVWKDKNFSLLTASLCLGYYGFVGNFFWMTLGWQRTYGNSPIEVAVKTLPGALGGIIMNVIAAMLMHRVSNKLLFMIASAANVAASVLLSVSSKSISYWALAFPWQLLAVTGGDITFCVTSVYIMSAIPSEQQSVAGGIFQTATRLITTVGLGISTTVFIEVGGSAEISKDASWAPYRSTFWVSLVGAVVAFALTPFLTLGKQGQRDASTHQAVD